MNYIIFRIVMIFALSILTAFILHNLNEHAEHLHDLQMQMNGIGDYIHGGITVELND